MTISELFAGYTDEEVKKAAESSVHDEAWFFAQIERRARRERAKSLERIGGAIGTAGFSRGVTYH